MTQAEELRNFDPLMLNMHPMQVATFSIRELPANWQMRARRWADLHHRSVCALDSNGYTHDFYSRFDWLLGAGALQEIEIPVGTANAWEQWRRWADTTANGKWLLGYLSYDLKNELEPSLRSALPHPIGTPLLHWFVPAHLLILQGQQLTVYSAVLPPAELLHAIVSTPTAQPRAADLPCVRLQARISREQYCGAVQRIIEDIAAGEYYEANFCQEFFQEDVDLVQPLSLFEALNCHAPAPFAAYYKQGQHYLLCASPERFLQRRGERLVSQPIKGTAARSVEITEDHALREVLGSSEKNRAENVMVVDMVRNDFTKVCATGSIQVPELFGVYGFPRVWQMISTVTGRLRPEVHWADAIAACFPMGSMTGAPKVAVMAQMEIYESTRRGLYSGTVGYLTPERDFDLNVVIRSLQYHRGTKYLCYHVGGAITFDSSPNDEYEECLLKMSNLSHALGMLAKEAGG